MQRQGPCRQANEHTAGSESSSGLDRSMQRKRSRRLSTTTKMWGTKRDEHEAPYCPLGLSPASLLCTVSATDVDGVRNVIELLPTSPNTGADLKTKAGRLSLCVSTQPERVSRDHVDIIPTSSKAKNVALSYCNVSRKRLYDRAACALIALWCAADSVPKQPTRAVTGEFMGNWLLFFLKRPERPSLSFMYTSPCSSSSKLKP
mmetsp:Transcript_66156/g.175327  ORF Transcript_66156/g.175327 Transcript_66156/m.175327 type:complete len:203 (-) Transcript_66156:3751-4359(-)